MPAQLNSFHNCYGAGHDEREKDFCSCSAFSMGLHLCEGDAALGKVAGGSGFGFFFFLVWGETCIYICFQSLGENSGSMCCRERRVLVFFFSTGIRAAVMLCCVYVRVFVRQLGGKNPSTHLCIKYPFRNSGLLQFLLKP